MWLGYFLASIKFLVLSWAINDLVRMIGLMILSIIFFLLGHYCLKIAFKHEIRKMEEDLEDMKMQGNIDMIKQHLQEGHKVNLEAKKKRGRPRKSL